MGLVPGFEPKKTFVSKKANKETTQRWTAYPEETKIPTNGICCSRGCFSLTFSLLHSLQNMMRKKKKPTKLLQKFCLDPIPHTPSCLHMSRTLPSASESRLHTLLLPSRHPDRDPRHPRHSKMFRPGTENAAPREACRSSLETWSCRPQAALIPRVRALAETAFQ